MTTRQQNYLLILLIVGAVVEAFVLLAETIPLGVPGEWVWLRLPAGTALAFNLGCAVLVLLCYYAFVRWGIKALGRWSKVKKKAVRKIALLVALFLASVSVIWNLKAIPGHVFGHSGMSWVIYYPRMSGYFTEAVTSQQSTSQFLKDYEQIAKQGDYLHQGTHPPGLILFYRVLHNLCQSSPQLVRAIIATETFEATAGLDELEDQSRAGEHPLTPQQRATLWLSIWVTLLIGAATVFPIYFFLSRHLSDRLAFAFSGLWPLVPAVSLFAPKSDLLLAFFSALLLCLWSRAITSRKLLSAVLAGLTIWVGMLISLAIVVAAVVLSFWTILDTLRLYAENRNSRGSRKEKTTIWEPVPFIPLAGILAGLSVPCLLMWALFDLNLLSVWLINLGKHAEFYEHNSRTFALWLLVNPIEMAFSLGVPLFILVVLACYRIMKNRLVDTVSLLNLSIVGGWFLLVLSGKNMGEAARLWIFLLPLMLSVAAFAWSRISIQSGSPTEKELQKEDAEPEPFPFAAWSTLFLAQALLCLVAVSSLDPFGFTDV